MTIYVEPKTGKRFNLTHAEVSAVLGETLREARERVWLSQASVPVPLEHDSESHSVVVSPTCCSMNLPEKNQYAIFILNKRGTENFVVAVGLKDSRGWYDVAFDTQQQAIDAYLGARQMYSENDAEVRLNAYNIFVRRMA